MKRWAIKLLLLSVVCWFIWNIGSFYVNFSSIPILQGVMQSLYCAPGETFVNSQDIYNASLSFNRDRPSYVCLKGDDRRYVHMNGPFIVLTGLIIISGLIVAVSNMWSKNEREDIDEIITR